MPTRSPSHIIEDESRKAFRQVLPEQWLFRDTIPDYGIDGSVELFNKDGSAAALIFLVQLKATENSDLKTALSLRFRVDTYYYYRGIDLPVMIVRFHSPTQKLFWKWFHEFIERPKEGSKTLTLHIPESSEWNSQTPFRIQKELQIFRELKAPSVRHPIEFNVVLADSVICGIPAPLIRSALLDAMGPDRDIIKLSDELSQESRPQIVLSSQNVIVTFAGLTSLTWRILETHPQDFATTTLVHDVLTAVAFVLSKAGHSGEAATLGRHHLAKSSMLNSPEIASEILVALARTRRITDALSLVQEILYLPQGARYVPWLLFPATLGRASMSTSEQEFLRKTMRLVIARAAEMGDRQAEAVAHYNLGNHLRNCGHVHLRAALAHYHHAARLDPGYTQRSYFWKEVGGILYLSHHFRCAATAYATAQRLGESSACVALRADSLMFSGAFREALDLFLDYKQKNMEIDAEWSLKIFMLNYLVGSIGIEVQKRNPKIADDLANVEGTNINEDEARGRLEQALRADALSNFGWFNLGSIYGRSGRSQDAFIAYLCAGLCMPHDIEAWCRAVMYSLNSRDNIALTIYVVR